MRLVLTPEQTKKLSSATGSVEVVDSMGHTVGKFSLSDPTTAETKTLTDEELAEVRRQIKEVAAERGSSFTAHQVLD